MRATIQTIREVLAITTISVLAGLLYNTFSPAGIALFGAWDPSFGVISARAKNDVVDHQREIIDIQVVKAIHDRGGAVFMDARTSDLYAEGHIPGALSVPVGGFEEKIENLFQQFPPDTPIVTYCTGRECQDSHMLAQYLADIGYTNVRVFSDGYPAWVAKGFPVE